jgi:hypothetical protein
VTSEKRWHLGIVVEEIAVEPRRTCFEVILLPSINSDNKEMSALLVQLTCSSEQCCGILDSETGSTLYAHINTKVNSISGSSHEMESTPG